MHTEDDTAASSVDHTQMTTDIVASYVSNNAVLPDQMAALIVNVHKAVLGLTSTPAPMVKQKPAVPVSRSITDAYVICLEDGAKLKMLKRYIRTRYNLSPDEYRKKWRLPADYPMVAPDYAKKRSKLAKEIGLGKGRAKKRSKVSA